MHSTEYERIFVPHPESGKRLGITFILHQTAIGKAVVVVKENEENKEGLRLASMRPMVVDKICSLAQVEPSNLSYHEDQTEHIGMYAERSFERVDGKVRERQPLMGRHPEILRTPAQLKGLVKALERQEQNLTQGADWHTFIKVPKIDLDP